MAGLPRSLYPASETSSTPLIETASSGGEGIEIQDTAGGHYSSMDLDKDALTNGTNFDGEDSSTSSNATDGENSHTVLCLPDCSRSSSQRNRKWKVATIKN